MGGTGSGEERILVIGGTGVVGAPIVDQLEQAGWIVRVTSRRAPDARGRFGPRVELVAADATRVEQLEHAMAGCQAVLICVSDLLDPWLDLRVTETVLELALRLGIERIGLISGASVAEERCFFPLINAKYQAEELLKAGGVPWVIVRLTWTMESLTRFIRGNGAAIPGRQTATIHPVAGDDVGRMVSRAFELDEAVGKTFTVHGPEATTVRHWLEQYCALTRPEVRVSQVPLWILSAVATFTRDATLGAVVALMRYFEDQPEYGDPIEACRILGEPTLTLRQWVARHPEALAAKAA